MCYIHIYICIYICFILRRYIESTITEPATIVYWPAFAIVLVSSVVMGVTQGSLVGFRSKISHVIYIWKKSHIDILMGTCSTLNTLSFTLLECTWAVSIRFRKGSSGAYLRHLPVFLTQWVLMNSFFTATNLTLFCNSPPSFNPSVTPWCFPSLCKNLNNTYKCVACHLKKTQYIS